VEQAHDLANDDSKAWYEHRLLDIGSVRFRRFGREPNLSKSTDRDAG
jgi:hypothetical protein